MAVGLFAIGELLITAEEKIDMKFVQFKLREMLLTKQGVG